MPTTAQDRIGRGPFGALLILLSLLLGSGTAAAAGFDIGPSAARLGPSRHSAAPALLPSGLRNGLDEDPPASGGDSSLPPFGSDLVTRLLWARPAAEPLSADEVGSPGPASAAYRARAPPAA